MAMPPTPNISIVKMRATGLPRHTTQARWQKPRFHLDRKLKGGTYVEWKGGTVGSAQSYLKMVTEFETKIKS